MENNGMLIITHSAYRRRMTLNWMGGRGQFSAYEFRALPWTTANAKAREWAGLFSGDVRSPQQHFFRDALSSADASRMASVLQVKRQCLADAAVEARLAELEAELEPQNKVLPFKRSA
jgi:hypothetical protein